MSDRLTRKNIKHDIKHDKFVEEVGTAYGFLARNRSRVLLIAALAVVAAAALVGYSFYMAGQEEKAQQRLAEAIAVMETPIEMTSQVDPNKPSATQFKNEEEKHAKAEPIFREIVEKYGRSDPADVANLYLARIAAARGNIADARPRLEKFIEEHDEHVLASSAKYSLYELRLSAGEADRVAAELEKELTDEKSLVPQDAALALLARAYESLGNDAKAKDAYRRIIIEFPESGYTLDAQRKTIQG